MKHLLLIFFCIAGFAACHQPTPAAGVSRSRSVAIAAPVRSGTMQQTTKVPAVSLYLKKSPVNTPIAGYITDVRVKPGDRVHAGDLLFTIESKEKKALGAWPGDNPGDSSNSFGVFHLTAPGDGVVTQMYQQQQGVFVPEGSPLCIIADPASVRFRLNVPFEEIALATQNRMCVISLPDGTRSQGHILGALTQMDAGSQSAPFLTTVDTHGFLPEGLVASARLVKYEKKDALLVPIRAVLSDELMRHFWVMRLISDSIAVKLPVTPGLKNDSLVELMSTSLSPGDSVLVEGNYGLPDTAAIVLHSY